MSDFTICVDIRGDLAEMLALVALANKETVWSAITRLLDKARVAEAHDKASRHMFCPGNHQAAGGSPAVSDSPSSKEDKPSVAIVAAELAPDDDDYFAEHDPEAARYAIALYDALDAADALLTRHEREQAGNGQACDCDLCSEVRSQPYTLECFLAMVEGVLGHAESEQVNVRREAFDRNVSERQAVIAAEVEAEHNRAIELASLLPMPCCPRKKGGS
jgi:hypothetical protein